MSKETCEQCQQSTCAFCDVHFLSMQDGESKTQQAGNGTRECPLHPAYNLFPCVMIVAVSMGELYSGDGCVVSYEGELGHGVQEWLDDYAGSLEELFCDGEELPSEPGLYKFRGDARVHIMGGSDEPISFHGEFIPMTWNDENA